jgi:hypothetical protein
LPVFGESEIGRTYPSTRLFFVERQSRALSARLDGGRATVSPTAHLYASTLDLGIKLPITSKAAAHWNFAFLPARAWVTDYRLSGLQRLRCALCRTFGVPKSLLKAVVSLLILLATAKGCKADSLLFSSLFEKRTSLRGRHSLRALLQSVAGPPQITCRLTALYPIVAGL